MRTFALLVLLGGLGLLGFGLWQFYSDRSEVRTDDARDILSDGSVSPPIWLAGALVLGGVAGMAASRTRRS